MATLIDQPPCPHLADFVNAVGKLIATVLDIHFGLRARQIAAVDIDDARHAQPIPSALSLRCNAERSMPTNSAVREMLPPNRLICATRYSRSNTSRASRNGKPINCSPPLPPGMVGTIEPTSGGSMLASITASG